MPDEVQIEVGICVDRWRSVVGVVVRCGRRRDRAPACRPASKGVAEQDARRQTPDARPNGA